MLERGVNDDKENTYKVSRLYIIGSGGFAREVAFLTEEIERRNPGSYCLNGFVDSKPNSLRLADREFPVLAENDFLDGLTGPVALALGIGDPHLSARVLQKFQNHRNSELLQYPNLLHPSFVGCSQSIRLGSGNIITAGVIFTVNIRVGSYNIFNLSTTVGHDSNIGSFNIFNPGCNVSGSVTVGDRNLIGTNATILQGLTLGSDIIVGAGSVVTKALDGGYVYVGSPARQTKVNAKIHG